VIEQGHTDQAAALPEVAARLSAVLNAQLEPMNELAGRLTEMWARPSARRNGFSGTEVSSLASQVESAIRQVDRMVGHGFIAAPGVVDGHERYMLWLQRKNGKIYRLRLNIDHSDPDSYEYVTMEWYVRAVTYGARVLTGPYLDYSGSNHFVLTFSAPVRSDGKLLGVVATDVLVHKAETEFVKILQRLDEDAVLANADRIVVAANSVRWIPGDRLPAHPADDPANFHSVVPLSDWTGWWLALASGQGDARKPR